MPVQTNLLLTLFLDDPVVFLSHVLSSQTIMRGLLPPDKQHQAEERALEDAEEEADIFEAEVERWKILVLDCEV